MSEEKIRDNVSEIPVEGDQGRSRLVEPKQGLTPAWAQVSSQAIESLPGALPDLTQSPYWGSVGPFVIYPQKLPLIQLTDRPVQLETPRNYFLTPFTPNAAFYVRWHLDEIPNAVSLSDWRLFIEGNVEKLWHYLCPT